MRRSIASYVPVRYEFLLVEPEPDSDVGGCAVEHERLADKALDKALVISCLVLRIGERRSSR
jgi:hypothetical protein